MKDERIQEIAKSVADQHAARFGIAIGDGSLYRRLMEDLTAAIKSALTEERREYVQEGWIAVPREIFTADHDARGPIWILDHRLAGETLEQAIAPYISHGEASK